MTPTSSVPSRRITSLTFFDQRLRRNEMKDAAKSRKSFEETARATIPMPVSFFWTCGFRLFRNAFVYSGGPCSSMRSTLLLYSCYPVSRVFSFLSRLVYYWIIKKKVDGKIAKTPACIKKALKRQKSPKQSCRSLSKSRINVAFCFAR